ncbi:unnamed protein product [Adineta steineri]|uniref:Uncharacterized protein n=2 Tax=Adineta steineri TaxID=433720 RepID=A0A819S7C8_9BILA|nr:unnamed protein product [Adineta steineri]
MTGTNDILAEFDAHVGDCSCHLRAQMLLSLTCYYRESKRREWIHDAIEALKNIKNNIITMYSDIHRAHGVVRSLGFSSLISLDDLFDRIGCTSLFKILDNQSSKIDSDSKDEKSIDTNPTIGHQNRKVTGDKWNLSDYRMVTRFLSSCRLLSLYKTATLEPGATHISYRLDPLVVFSENKKQLDQLDLLTNFITHHDLPSRTTLINEMENMQIYITELTSDWISRLSDEIGLGEPIQRLLQNSTRLSVRKLRCIPAYPSLLAIRFEWFVKNIPLFLVVRRFCTEGYHNAFYRISVKPTAVRHYIEAVRQNNAKIVDHGNVDWFDVTSVSLNSVLLDDWARQPHVIIISNSIAGSMDDFHIRMGDDNQNGVHNESCPEYDMYVKNELSTLNFSAAIMNFFTIHDQYPFDLGANENEWDVIGKIVDSTLGYEAATIYRQTVDESHKSNDGRVSLGFLSFQHMFAEFPIVIARQTEQIILHNEKPAPYGYRWANASHAAVNSSCSKANRVINNNFTSINHLIDQQCQIITLDSD